MIMTAHITMSNLDMWIIFLCDWRTKNRCDLIKNAYVNERLTLVLCSNRFVIVSPLPELLIKPLKLQT